ncbi:MAG: selenide, water dikinase SelD [Thermoleophilia bacterium]|nr:selenide, water dikinase SelD [Thermoleophilia bacterium]
MQMLPPVVDPALLVGSDTLDDAAVYQLTDELALVQTVDFFTPVVDDPFDFGRIAAANAFSDIYAMGARPVTALNMVGFPNGTLPLEYLGRILQGGAETARLAGVTIVGGHTIDDPEPKYGLAVTGVVRPGEQLTNAGAAPSDLLVLTKPIGTGIVATAIKLGKASAEVIAAATDSMVALNKDGAEVARAHGVRALTDITGFGLLGHLTEMCRASGVTAELWFDRLPLLLGAAELVQAGVAPGGTQRNLEYVQPWTVFGTALEPWQRLLCADAQTSGGLLLSVPARSVQAVVRELVTRGTPAAAVIGTILAGGEDLLSVRSEAPTG